MVGSAEPELHGEPEPPVGSGSGSTTLLKKVVFGFCSELKYYNAYLQWFYFRSSLTESITIRKKSSSNR